ncbi:MAG: WGR domain-containing protein [Candidatus Thiodiazotropha sp. (ex Lucinoma kastoroae)]|nr:WGR domain-containing protein [Candidatus Thiodiazotropha sp. (ex Lucinoma kastoroae)]
MQIGYLHQIIPEQNAYRFYSVHIAPTLFGEWSIVYEWGRIGQPGQLRMKVFPDEHTALCAGRDQLSQKERHGYCQAVKDWPINGL